jgi:hypothetical protein
MNCCVGILGKTGERQCDPYLVIMSLALNSFLLFLTFHLYLSCTDSTEAVFLYWFAGFRQMSLCFCPLIFNSNAGHKNQSVGLKDHATHGSRVIKCPHKMLKLSAHQECAVEIK